MGSCSKALNRLVYFGSATCLATRQHAKESLQVSFTLKLQMVILRWFSEELQKELDRKRKEQELELQMKQREMEIQREYKRQVDER